MASTCQEQASTLHHVLNMLTVGPASHTLIAVVMRASGRLPTLPCQEAATANDMCEASAAASSRSCSGMTPS
jgi:hypothetical protein